MTMILNYPDIDSIRRRFPHNQTSSSLVSSLPFNDMADDMIRPDHNDDPDQPNRIDESWLCLRLGSTDDQPSSSTPHTQRGGLVELDLLPVNSNSQQQHVTRNTRPAGFFHIPEFSTPPKHVAVQLMNQQQGQIGNYYLTNNRGAHAMSLMMPTMGPNIYVRPNYYGSQMGLNGGESSSGSGMRIIRSPRRPHVGIWFMLQASRNQVREPFLPQVPKSYLRIKNGRMTVRLLIKYLVQKLGLGSESEVEIRCRGQELQPILMLQHVRDNIWFPRRDTDSPSSSSMFPSNVVADSHIMILHYARPILSSNADAVTIASTTTSSAPNIS